MDNKTILDKKGDEMEELMTKLTLPIGENPSPWELVKTTKDNIRMFRRRFPESAFDCIRCDGEFKVSTEDVNNVVFPRDVQPLWDENFACDDCVETIDDRTFVQWEGCKAIFPSKARDCLIIRRHLKGENGSIMNSSVCVWYHYRIKWSIKKMSIEHEKVPEKSDYVRCSVLSSGFHMIPIDSETIQIRYICWVDPKGWIPAWIVNRTYNAVPIRLAHIVKLAMERSKTQG